MKIRMIMQNMDFFNGCVFLRNIVPCQEVTRLGHEVELVLLGTNFPIEEICKSDLVVFSRTYQSDIFPVMNALKKAKVKTIYETDDDLESLDENNPTRGAIDRTMSTIKMLGYECDAITTTTPYLAKELEKRYHKKVYVLPNALMTEQYQVGPRNPVVTVGWTGGCTHAVDLLLILDQLIELQNVYRFHFIFQGFSIAPLDGQEFVWRRMRDLGLNMDEKVYVSQAIEMCEKMKKMKSFQFVPFYPTEMFGQLMSKLAFDIGLCPLLDSPFNRAKSCIKYYEYALSGAATLASDVVPYNTEVPYMFNNTPDDFKNKMEALLGDKSLRERMAKDQREWVLENRSASKVAKLWEAAFKETRES